MVTTTVWRTPGGTEYRQKVMAVDPADTETLHLSDFKMKMRGRQVEMKVSSCISEHHSLYQIRSMKAKKLLRPSM